MRGEIGQEKNCPSEGVMSEISTSKLITSLNKAPSVGHVANAVMKNHVNSPRKGIASLRGEIDEEDKCMEKVVQ